MTKREDRMRERIYSLEGQLVKAAIMITEARERAEAAEKRVKELSEPDDAMIEAGEDEIEQHQSMGLRAYAADIYCAMMRAALEGPNGER